MRRRGEVLIASAAAPALGDEQRLFGGDHLAEDFAGVRVADFRPGGDGQIHILGRLSAHVLALAVLPSLRAPMRVVAIVEKCREVRVDSYEHASTYSTITTIRSALWDKFLSSE